MTEAGLPCSAPESLWQHALCRGGPDNNIAQGQACAGKNRRWLSSHVSPAMPQVLALTGRVRS